jgi:hypothetical protein
MSRIERIATKQGHPIPRTGGGARGPFPAELYTSMPVVEHYEQISGNGGPEIPVGGTAQNGFRDPNARVRRETKYFRCRDCEGIVSEWELEEHECGEENA